MQVQAGAKGLDSPIEYQAGLAQIGLPNLVARLIGRQGLDARPLLVNRLANAFQIPDREEPAD